MNAPTSQSEGKTSTIDQSSVQAPRRTLRANFLINVAGALVPLAVSLVTVPIYIRHIGPARYGVLSIVWVLLGYFGFLDLGLSRAAANALARLRGAPQEVRARLLVTTVTLNLALGLMGSLVLALAGNLLLQRMLSIPAELKPEIAAAFPWIVGLFPLALLSGVAVGALEAREEFLQANLLGSVGSSLGQIVPALLAVSIGPSLAVVVPAAVVVRALTVLAFVAAMLRLDGPLRPRQFDPRQVGALFRYGGWVSVSGVVGPILTSVDQLIIGALLGVEKVTYYAVPMNLIVRSQIFVAALSRTLFPRFSRDTPEVAKELAMRALLVVGFGYAMICAPAIVAAPLFLRLWIGPDFAGNATPIICILFLGSWINGLALVPFQLLLAQGRPDTTGKFHLLELIPFVLVLWELTKVFGLIGAAAAWSLRNAADAFLLFWVADFKLPGSAPLLVPFCTLNLAVLASLWCSGNVIATVIGTAIISAMSLLSSWFFVGDIRSLGEVFLSRLGLLQTVGLECGSVD